LEQPLFSLVTGSRNRPESLERFLASVKEHTTHPYEVLIADASDTPYESGDERVRVFPEPEPLGFVRGYNRVFPEARADWVVWLNDDVELMPGWSRLLAATISRGPQVDLFCLPLSEPGEEEPFLLLYHGLPLACFGCMRRLAGEALGWFDEGFGFYGADPDLSLRVTATGRRIAPVLGRPLFHHREEDDLRPANEASSSADTARLDKLWRRKVRSLRRLYRKRSKPYFGGLKKGFCERYWSPTFRIPVGISCDLR
jgi:GT2 family glycosyltransferase